MRVIIRFSLNRDTQSALRNALKANLENAGIMWTGRTTGTYEGDIPEAKIRTALGKFWNTAASHLGSAHIDHFWMYTDRKALNKGD